MSDETFREAVRTVFPCASTGISLHPHSPFGPGHGSIYLQPDTTWNYDELVRLSLALGTTDLRFVWATNPGYSEYTPGDPDTVTIEVRWPPNPSPPAPPPAKVTR